MLRNYRLTLIVVVIMLVVAVARPAAGFLSDLAGHWAAPLIGALQARGIVAGGDSGLFNPEGPLTRGQLAKLLVNSLGAEEDANILSGYPSRFTDVPGRHWARGFIEALAETGSVEGYPGGAFGPDDTVTRAQLATILVRAAGQSDQARLMRLAKTDYRDDADIPDWARGAVHVARSVGLMQGGVDGLFRPQQAVTRAEGSVSLFRLMSARGNTFHLTGTLLKFDPATRQGALRDELGRDVPFAMGPTAEYYRGGNQATAPQIRPLDQVWIVSGADGQGRFMDARASDVLAADAVVDGQNLTVTLNGGVKKRYGVQPGALIFLDGKPATLAQTAGANTVFLMVDRISDEARVVDAVRAPIHATVIGYDPVKALLHVQIDTETEPRGMTVAADAVLLLNGQRVRPDDFRSGDKAQFAVNEAGAVTYLLAER